MVTTLEDGARGPLHPQVKTLFDTLLAARPTVRVFDAAAMQALDAVTATVLNIDAPARPVQREITIAGAGAPEVRALVFAPEHVAGGAMPVLMYMHGGGFVVWSPETHAKICKRLAIGAGAIVVSIDYRRTPAHPYPAPLDDCVGAFRWLRANASSFGGDPARIAVVGDSAGGNLAAAVALRLLAGGEPPPNAVLLLCAWTDLHHTTESFELFGPDDPIIDDPTMDFFRTRYAPDPSQWDDPFVSPLRGDMSTFPPTCVIAGGIDPLRDDGVLFAEKLRAASRVVDEHIYEGMPHEFMLWFPEIDAAQPAIDAACVFLKRTLAASPAATA